MDVWRDAMRYRWLRDNQLTLMPGEEETPDKRAAVHIVSAFMGDDWDDMVDREMKGAARHPALAKAIGERKP